MSAPDRKPTGHGAAGADASVGQAPGSESPAALKARWEQRAVEQGMTLSGVLYRGLPDVLNDYLHRWHAELITTRVLPRVPRGGRVLDLGCGFGRLGAVVRAARPDIELIGVDLAANYCRMFSDATGSAAVCADLGALPVAPATMDAVIAVTSLMYVAPAERALVLRALHGLVVADGCVLLVDPGHEFTALVAALRPSSRDTPTGGNWFRLREYDALARDSGARVLGRGGVPVFSLTLPLLFVLARWPGVTRAALSLVRMLDRLFGGLRRLTIHRWMVTAP